MLLYDFPVFCLRCFDCETSTDIKNMLCVLWKNIAAIFNYNQQEEIFFFLKKHIKAGE